MIEPLVMFDTTGDGVDDTMAWMDDSHLYYAQDLSGDGNIDTIIAMSDFDEYGNPHQTDFSFDSDANGIPDTFRGETTDDWGNVVSMYDANDYNQDGTLDMAKIFGDTTGDGNFDTVATMHADNSDSNVVYNLELHQDFTGNHTPDLSMKIVGYDTTGDGEPDVMTLTVAGEDGVYSDPIEMTYEEFESLNELNYATNMFSDSAVVGNFDPETNPELVSGDPAESMGFWEYQGNTGRCAIYAQKFAIEEILGHEIPIEELVSVAEENGWFNEEAGGGTVTLNMDKLLEYYGVEHEMSFDNDINSLEEALNNGQKVIVGVDSGQIWYGDENNIFSPENAADHAVEVIGIDHSDPNNPMVVLNDSGTPNGCGEMVPLDVFENAWSAGDSQMIVCWA